MNFRTNPDLYRTLGFDGVYVSDESVFYCGNDNTKILKALPTPKEMEKIIEVDEIIKKLVYSFGLNQVSPS